jgi:hypothetical protein
MQIFRERSCALMLQEVVLMRLLTAEDVSSILQVPIARVYELARENVLPCFQHPGVRDLISRESRERGCVPLFVDLASPCSSGSMPFMSHSETFAQC